MEGGYFLISWKRTNTFHLRNFFFTNLQFCLLGTMIHEKEKTKYQPWFHECLRCNWCWSGHQLTKQHILKHNKGYTKLYLLISALIFLQVTTRPTSALMEDPVFLAITGVILCFGIIFLLRSIVNQIKYRRYRHHHQRSPGKSKCSEHGEEIRLLCRWKKTDKSSTVFTCRYM